MHIGVGFPETRTVKVVGVVGDLKNRTLGDVARPMVFTSILQDPLGWQAAALAMRRSPLVRRRWCSAWASRWGRPAS